MTNADNVKKATVRDNTLVLYFDTAENPLVARFDLESLAQAHFEVAKRDAGFVLILRDFSGAVRDIAQFGSKADAHQALYAILQALLDHDGGVSGTGKKCGGKGSWFLCLIKWFFILAGVVSVAWLLMLAFTTPPDLRGDMSTPAVVTPKAEGFKAPEGEAFDLDSVLPSESAAPQSETPQ